MIENVRTRVRLSLIGRKVLPFISSPTRRRLLNGAFWGGVASVSEKSITLLCAFAVARILGRTGFGEYGIINNTAGVIGVLAGLGIGHTVTKYVAELKYSDPVRAGRILALSFIVTILSAVLYGGSFVIFAPWLAEKTLAAPALVDPLRISAITVALGVVNGVQTASLIGCEAFRIRSYISFVSSLLQAILVILGAYYWGLNGAVLALAIGMVVMVVLTKLAIRREWKKYTIKLQWESMWQEWRVLVDYSLPTFLILIFLGPVTWATNAFLANQPNGYAELGVFNAALQWQTAIQFLPGVVCSAMIPVMSEKCGNGRVLDSLVIMKKMIKSVFLIASPLAILLCLLSPIIMRGYGVSFADGYIVMVFLVMAGALGAIVAPVGHFVMANGMMWMAFLFNFGWIISMLVGGWYLVKWGAEGLAVSRLVAIIVHSLLLIVFVKKVSDKIKNIE